MNINGIEHIANNIEGAAITNQVRVAKPEVESDFSNWLSGQLSGTNKYIQTAETELRNMAAGETDNIHHVMLSLEKAKTSMELVVEVRNKLLEGYQEIMRMQV